MAENLRNIAVTLGADEQIVYTTAAGVRAVLTVAQITGATGTAKIRKTDGAEIDLLVAEQGKVSEKFVLEGGDVIVADGAGARFGMSFVEMSETVFAVTDAQAAAGAAADSAGAASASETNAGAHATSAVNAASAAAASESAASASATTASAAAADAEAAATQATAAASEAATAATTAQAANDAAQAAATEATGAATEAASSAVSAETSSSTATAAASAAQTSASEAANSAASGGVRIALTVAGSDAIALSLNVTASSYVAPLTVIFEAVADNTGAVTLDLDGLGAKALRNPDGTELTAGDLKAGTTYLVVYDGAEFRLIGGVGGGIDVVGSLDDTALHAGIRWNGIGWELHRFADEPRPSAIALTAPAADTGASSWTVEGYPTGFGPARVMASGDIEVSVNGGGYTTQTTAMNGDVLTVRPVGTLVDQTIYAGKLEVGGESADYSFQYQEAFIATPSFTSHSDGQGGLPNGFTLIASPYDVQPGSSLDALNPHASTDWYLRSADGSVDVWSSVGDTVNLVQIDVPVGVVEADTSYQLQVVYNSDTGLTAASMPIVVTTMAAFTAPAKFVGTILDRTGSGSISADGRTIYNVSGNTQALSLHTLPPRPTYFEVEVVASAGYGMIGVSRSGASVATYPGQSGNDGWGYYAWNGTKYNGGGVGQAVTYGAGYGAGSIIGVAVDPVNGRIWFRKDGTWQGGGDPAAGTNPAFSNLPRNVMIALGNANGADSTGMTARINTGHAAFAHEPPVGFSGVVGEWVREDDVDAVFRSCPFDGIGKERPVWHGLPFDATNDDLFVILKSLGEGGKQHWWYDSVRPNGQTHLLNMGGADAEATGSMAGITSLSSGAFGVGATTNTSGAKFAAFVFKKAANFLELKTVNHVSGTATEVDLSSLGQVGLVIAKGMGVSHWRTWHRNDGTTSKGLYLNLPNPGIATSGITVVGTTLTIASNVGSDTILIAAFAHNEGNGWRVKCGAYSGTGAAQEIDCGGPVQFVLIKSLADMTNWNLHDLTLGGLVNGVNRITRPNLADVPLEIAAVEPSPRGFRLVGAQTEHNASGSSYVYVVIRRGPMAAVDEPTQVYRTVNHTGNLTTVSGMGFVPDVLIHNARNVTQARDVVSRLMTTDQYLMLSAAAATTVATLDVRYKSDGIAIGGAWPATDPLRFHGLRRMPGIFSPVMFRGTGAAGLQVPHDLAATPEMMLLKRLDAATDWLVYHAALGPSSRLYFNTNTAAMTDAGAWNNTAPENTRFTLGASANANAAGAPVLALLFASKPGMSKVGTFTINGSGAGTVTGLGFRPRLIWARRHDSAQSWYMWNSEMGMTPATAPGAEGFLLLSPETTAESSFDYLDATDDGFNMKGWNANSQMLYLALA